MLKAFAVLLVCQLAGETIARALALPVPGPVLGLGLLFAMLLLRDRLQRRRADALASLDAAPEAPLGRAADGLLAMLGLLFVPAGVGIVDHLGLFAAHGWALAAILLVSMLATLLLTVFTFLLVARRLARPGDDAA